MHREEYIAADRESLWHPYTKHSAVSAEELPLIVRGEGPFLFDSDGTRYFDAVSSWWACNLGHGHPRVVEAIIRQTREHQHSILGNMTHPRAVELAKAVTGLIAKSAGSPVGSYKAFFSSDGASSVEAALKIAVQYWRNIGQGGRTGFVSFRDAYHGDTMGAVSLGYMESFHKQFKSLIFQVHRVDAPCCSLCRWQKKTSVTNQRCRDFACEDRQETRARASAAPACHPDTDPLQPSDCGLECIAAMKETLEQHGKEIAAVVVEPLCQGASGMRIYSPRYLARLGTLCKAAGVLLIVDEIAMGFGRTGTMYAFEQAGIAPDIVCIGKGLSAGYLPISAAVVSNKIYDTFADKPEDHTFYHGHTFAGNPIACAAALETIKVYEDERILILAGKTVSAVTSLMDSFRGMRNVADVRHVGMVFAVELGAKPGDPAGIEMARKVRKELMKRGILLRPLDNVVYLMPPLNTPPDLVIDSLEAVKSVIEKL